ncbi:hypothetical protein BOSEA31B_13429 [Hyphomicrobiales bacterium]|nr:hypothetical protein BOSEA31B_13429 [Hyphomicrobiales bacterium]CAH1699199.1 hypothetical protein BOSEA1005_12252 [Hyphomicrobiales bacterium]CAI0342985.1 hypothetical protein BO1005MUT1_210050 [Hyphomicrobiales bacterium]
MNLVPAPPPREQSRASSPAPVPSPPVLVNMGERHARTLQDLMAAPHEKKDKFTQIGGFRRLGLMPSAPSLTYPWNNRTIFEGTR